MNSLLETVLPPTGWGIAGALIVSATGWLVTHAVEHRRLTRLPPMTPQQKRDFGLLQETAERLYLLIPGLPKLPIHHFEYGPWFWWFDAIAPKRLKIRAEKQTAVALTELYANYVKFFETLGQLRRVGAKESLETKKLEAQLDLADCQAELEKAKIQMELTKLHLEKEKAEREIERIKYPRAENSKTAAQESIERDLEKLFSPLRTVEAIRRRAEEEKEKFKHDPVLQKAIDRRAEAAINDLMEGHK